MDKKKRAVSIYATTLMGEMRMLLCSITVSPTNLYLNTIYLTFKEHSFIFINKRFSGS